MAKYVCSVCGYIYDEAKGIPEAGIAPGTTCEELPEDWVCPLCGATKAEFEKQGEHRNKALYASRRKINRGCFCNKGFNRGSLYSSRYAKHGLWNEIVTIRSRPMYGYPYAVDS